MRPPHNVWIIPSDIKGKIARKYGVEAFYVIRMYYSYWEEVKLELKNNLSNIEKGEDNVVSIPHIGDFHIIPKTLRHLNNHSERVAYAKKKREIWLKSASKKEQTK